jgi:hypothetical protein
LDKQEILKVEAEAAAKAEALALEEVNRTAAEAKAAEQSVGVVSVKPK